jgi:hypothetical protein
VGFLVAKPIIAMCSAAFARLEGIAFTSKEKLALSLLFAVLFAVTVYRVVAILRFIQLRLPLPPVKLTAQSRRGVPRLLEAQRPPLILRIPVPPAYEAPHALIDPSALIVAKALAVE